MMVALIDDGDFNARTGQSVRHGQAAEARTDDDHVVLHRVASS